MRKWHGTRSSNNFYDIGAYEATYHFVFGHFMDFYRKTDQAPKIMDSLMIGPLRSFRIARQ